MPNAMDVARFFLAVAPENDITNLKLQKLCAYAQAVSLAYAGHPLFDEDIEAWTHGPVVPSVYQEFKAYKDAAIPAQVEKKTALTPFSQEQRNILQMTWPEYGRFTAWGLRDQSHNDFPGDFGSRRAIPKEDIAEAFKDKPLVQQMRADDKDANDGDA